MGVLEIYDNTFPEEYLNQFNQLSLWEIKGDHLYNDLCDIEFFAKTCVEWINSITNTEHELYRCYRHAIHSRSLQKPHHDVNANRTFLVYMHPTWNKLWGGQLRVGDELETQIDPIPNRSVYFSTEEHYHYATPPNTNEFRITYVWKLQTV